MRPRYLVPLLALLAATPVTAQMPINGVGNAGGADMQRLRRWLGRSDDRPDRYHSRYRSADLAGQIGLFRRRIDDMRDSGQITRAEARRLRREASGLALVYWRYGGDGLSDSEAAELQARLFAANSLAAAPRLRAGR